MNKRTKKLLEFLSDALWHLDLPRDVGVNTVNACIMEGFVKTRRIYSIKTRSFQEYRIAIHITALGAKELKKHI